jgi:hypothetical protein
MVLMVMVLEDSETCDLHFVSTPTGISSTITLTTIAHSLSPSQTIPMEYLSILQRPDERGKSGMFWS